MFGAFVRGALAFAFSALMATVLTWVLDPIIDIIIDAVGAEANVAVWMEAISTFFIFVCFLSICVSLLARANAESGAV